MLFDVRVDLVDPDPSSPVSLCFLDLSSSKLKHTKVPSHLKEYHQIEKHVL